MTPMDDIDALDAARIRIDEALDCLDVVDEQSTATALAVALLTAANLAVKAVLRSRNRDEGV